MTVTPAGSTCDDTRARRGPGVVARWLRALGLYVSDTTGKSAAVAPPPVAPAAWPQILPGQHASDSD